MNNQSDKQEIIMTNTRNETAEERMNPPLDSPWNKMAVPTLDILEEVLNELIKKEQQEKEKRNGTSTATF